MKITNNINKPAQIFSEIEIKNTTKPANVNIKENKFDFFEKQKSRNKTVNRKLALAGVAIGVVAIIGTILCIKNKNGKVLQEKASNIFKQNQNSKISNTTEKLLNANQQPAITKQVAEVAVQKERWQQPVIVEQVAEVVVQKERWQQPEIKSADEYLENCIRNAKRALITDLKANNGTGRGGVALYGPESTGKTAVIDDLLHSIEEAGVYVEKIPRLDTTNNETIEKSKDKIINAIANAHEAAEARFKATKQNSVIVVNDMDKIALDRHKYFPNMIIPVLLDFEKATERGYSWLAIGDSFKNVNNAVRRAGRISYFIPCRPSLNDPKEVWQKYVDILETIGNTTEKEILLNDAVEKMKNLFG